MTGTNWANDWTVTQAMEMLCSDFSPNAHSRGNLEKRVVDALPLTRKKQLIAEEPERNQYARGNPVQRVSSRMKQLGIAGERMMPPVLWIRLMHTAQVALTTSAIRRFG